MATGNSDRKFLIGLAVGVGLGLAAALLLSPRQGARRRQALLDRARSVGETARSLGQRYGRTERAGRVLMKRIERLRSAGL